MEGKKELKLNSKCVHAGIDEYEFGPVVPPIYQTSTFKFASTEQGAALFKGEAKGYIYTRLSNPTIEAMENAVADLEEGYKALGCSSGMSAITTALMALINAGDHVICSKAVYGPTTNLIKDILGRFNIDHTFVDTTKIENVKAAITDKTKVVYIETPANPTLDITDIEETANLAHENGALLVVDNTFLSPALQQPLKLGADVVLHSMTKFLNGHADVVAGVLVAKNEELYLKLKGTLKQLGGVIDPFNAFLVHRGIKTLGLRMEKHCANAQKIAEFLERHPKVAWVSYPGLESHPQHEVAKKQQYGYGGMISFELKGGLEAGKTVMDSVKLCTLAVSLGGVETLIQHPASMTHLSMGKELREAAGITDGLVRLSVGIEDADDLIADLSQALEKI